MRVLSVEEFRETKPDPAKATTLTTVSVSILMDPLSFQTELSLPLLLPLTSMVAAAYFNLQQSHFKLLG